MQETFGERVYDTLNGLILPDYCVPGVENAFDGNRPCMQLYAEASDAYNRLCERLGVVDEDEDVEIIFNSFLDMNRILSLKMFYYGTVFHSAELQKAAIPNLPDTE